MNIRSVLFVVVLILAAMALFFFIQKRSEKGMTNVADKQAGEMVPAATAETPAPTMPAPAPAH